MRQSHSLTMSGEQAADLILLGTYVRRVGVKPRDPSVYITVRHLYRSESTVLRNVMTGEERLCLWDEIEFV